MITNNQLRVRRVPAVGLHFPPTAQLLLNWAESTRHSNGSLSFAVDRLPPSVNHIYVPGRGGQRRLSPDVFKFRKHVADALKPVQASWVPTGTLFALILYENPYWLTKKRTVRVVDLDNLQKSLFDAISRAVKFNDALVWEYHAYKVYSDYQRTTVYIRSLGDIVEHAR